MLCMTMLITLAVMWKMQHFYKVFHQVSMHYTSLPTFNPINCLRFLKSYDQRSALDKWAAVSSAVMSRVNSDSECC